DADTAEAQLITRLSQYLSRWGTSDSIRRVLPHFFLHLVQFKTDKPFLGVPRRSQAFAKPIVNLDGVSHKTVTSCCASFEKTKRPLDLPAATALVRQIEQRLRGN